MEGSKSNLPLEAEEDEASRRLALRIAKQGAPAAMRTLQELHYRSTNDRVRETAARDLLRAANVIDGNVTQGGVSLHISDSNVNLLLSTLTEINRGG